MVFCLFISSTMAFHCITTASFSFSKSSTFLHKGYVTIGGTFLRSFSRATSCGVLLRATWWLSRRSIVDRSRWPCCPRCPCFRWGQSPAPASLSAASGVLIPVFAISPWLSRAIGSSGSSSRRPAFASIRIPLLWRSSGWAIRFWGSRRARFWGRSTTATYARGRSAVGLSGSSAICFFSSATARPTRALFRSWPGCFEGQRCGGWIPCFWLKATALALWTSSTVWRISCRSAITTRICSCSAAFASSALRLPALRRFRAWRTFEALPAVASTRSPPAHAIPSPSQSGYRFLLASALSKVGIPATDWTPPSSTKRKFTNIAGCQ